MRAALAAGLEAGAAGPQRYEHTTMIYTHVLKVAAGGTASPLDALSRALPGVSSSRMDVLAGRGMGDTATKATA